MAWRLISAEANSVCSVLLRMWESLLDILTKRNTWTKADDEHLHLLTDLAKNTVSGYVMELEHVMCVKYLSMPLRSLRYMVLSGWMDECRRLWERPECWSWEVDREARTLAAAEAAVLGGMKRWSRPCSPDAVRMGCARTLASRLSGWKQKVNTEPPSKYDYIAIMQQQQQKAYCSWIDSLCG